MAKFVEEKEETEEVTEEPETSEEEEEAAEAPSKAELKKLIKNQLIEFAERKNLKVKKSGTKAAVINEIHSQLK